MKSFLTPLALLTLGLAACGGGGEPSAPGLRTDVPLDKKLSELSNNDRYYFCHDLFAYQDTLRDASLERMCAAEAREGLYPECDETYEACLADPPRDVGTEHVPSEYENTFGGCAIPDCDATVAELVACYEATVTVQTAVLDVFRCEGVSDEEEAQLDDIAEREDRRCDAIRAKCPGAIE